MFHKAVDGGKFEVIKFLVESNFNINDVEVVCFFLFFFSYFFYLFKFFNIFCMKRW